MSRDRAEMLRCFYCNTPTFPGGREMDHFPIPNRSGGKEVVPACTNCHTLKDRIPLGEWGWDLWGELSQAMTNLDWTNVPPVFRLFYAKCVAVLLDGSTNTNDSAELDEAA